MQAFPSDGEAQLALGRVNEASNSSYNISLGPQANTKQLVEPRSFAGPGQRRW
jgi:hypothetical protein